MNITREEKMRNAIGILKLIAQGEGDIRNGRVKHQEDVFKDIEVRAEKGIPLTVTTRQVEVVV